jgi:hypothetical protein
MLNSDFTVHRYGSIICVPNIPGSQNTFFTDETEVVFFLGFSHDLLLFKFWGVLALDSPDFTRVGIQLTLDTDETPVDFRALDLTSGAFLLVTNAYTFNHMCLLCTRINKLILFLLDITEVCKIINSLYTPQRQSKLLITENYCIYLTASHKIPNE